MGMGTVIEYAITKGDPRWMAPPVVAGIICSSAKQTRRAPEPDGRFEISIGKINGGPGKFNRWRDQRQVVPEHRCAEGARGKAISPLAMKNTTDDPHPMHLHRHVFELVNVDGKAAAGIMKDTVVVRPYGSVEVEFVANQPGPTLLHFRPAGAHGFSG